MDEDLPREIKYAFISIVKEAVNNIHKHSSGDSGRIIVREHPGFYLLQIRDNGSPEKLPPETDGIGLSGIRDRVHSLGGTMRIDTAHGIFIKYFNYKRSQITLAAMFNYVKMGDFL